MGLSPELMDALANQLVLPILRDFDKEDGRAIFAKLVIVFEGGVVSCEVHSRGANSPDESSGEVRIRVKDGYGKDSYNFAAESIFNGVGSGTGFSGFAVRGKLTLADGQPMIRLIARTHRYNVWDWGDEFRL
jgi:hypothetical protein